MYIYSEFDMRENIRNHIFFVISEMDEISEFCQNIEVLKKISESHASS